MKLVPKVNKDRGLRVPVPRLVTENGSLRGARAEDPNRNPYHRERPLKFEVSPFGTREV